MAPQSHPRAQFVPIPPDLDLSALVENTSNFDYVTRLPNEMLKELSIQSLEQLVLLHVVIGGKPLVIEGWGEALDPYLFSPGWLQQNLGKKPEEIRDIPNEVNIPMTMGHYIKSMGQLTTQFTSSNYRDPKRQRLYLKDIDCPDEWARDLKGFIPEIFYYLNECIESRTGGDGAILEPNEYGQMRYGKGVAPAGDLMSSLPPEMRALNMMCYIGHEGTYTPAHREMCASLGHNIMVETSIDSKNEKAGSSVWFMTETKERDVVSEYFLSMLGHDIEVEKHFAQINAWKKAPFNVWVVEQKVGDLILIPPLAPHQVWNRGTRTMKAAWNRTTVDTLEFAINEALPRARMVCREEQYKNKAIIYYTLVKYHRLVTRDTVEQKMWKYGRIKQLFEDFKRLFALFTDILVSEMFSAALPAEKDVEFLEYDSNVTCSYCRCNIWNRFLTCKTCIELGSGGEDDTYDICMDCYVMGRSCGCISNLKWVEQWNWSTLAMNYEAWRQTVVQYDGFFNLQASPQPLEVARKRFGRKPAAQICQEQLKIRPWQDVKNPPPREPSVSSDEPDVDDEGRTKKRKGKKPKSRPTAKKGKTHHCHVCCRHHENWKLAFCTTCPQAYCYGVLWRAFDLMPQTVMEDRDWSCPKCLQICSCGACRKKNDQTPYQPKGTLLGHDTRKVADFRSVESLVDFSKTNLGWLRGENDDHPQESARMKKLREKAEAEKSREDVIDENYLVEDGGARIGTEQRFANDYPQYDNMEDIDPELRHGSSAMLQSNGNEGGHYDGLYTAANAETNDTIQVPADGDGEENYDWLDDHYDLEYIEAFNRGAGAAYPPKMIAPAAPMQAPISAAAPARSLEPEPELEMTYPEPPAGQSRMMGIGYYQQRGGIDKIAYDPPSLDTADSSNADLTTAANNPNFALSDLLPQQEEQSTKKRRHRSHDEDDVEFFSSKKARIAAETKRRPAPNKIGSAAGKVVNHKQAPAPRRVPKPKPYVDLGEESLPYIEEDMAPAVPKTEHAEGDLELAAQAMNRLTKNPDSEKGKGKSRRRQINSTTPSAAPTPAKLPRKSAWPARKEAGEAGEELPLDKPKKKRGQPRGSSSGNPKTMATIDISSDRSSDDDEGGVRIDDGDDSLFGDPDTGRKSSDGFVFTKKDTIKVQATAPLDESENEQQAEKPSPKRRGRPPKHRPAPVPAGTTKLLSLKEKLALKGKGPKIVAKKQHSASASPAPTPNVPTARNTPSIVIPNAITLGSPAASSEETGSNIVHQSSKANERLSPEAPKGPQAENSLNRASTVTRYGGSNRSQPEKPFKQPSVINRLESFEKPVPKPSISRSPTIIRKDFSEAPQFGNLSNSAPTRSKPALAPVKNGPTVVRLESPSDDSDGSDSPSQRETISSDDDSVESISAVRTEPKMTRGGGSFRGRGVSNGVGPGMAKRGRPPKSSC